jgi:hypothetical protein
MGSEGGEVVTKSVGAEDRDIFMSQTLLKMMDKAVIIADQATTGMKIRHDLGAGIDGSPDLDEFVVAADGGGELIKL